MSNLLPLADVRICDFTAVWAGQSATMYLADLGADCIKVENPFVWNPMTRAAAPNIDARRAALAPVWIGGHPKATPDPGHGTTPPPLSTCSATRNPSPSIAAGRRASPWCRR